MSATAVAVTCTGSAAKASHAQVGKSVGGQRNPRTSVVLSWCAAGGEDGCMQEEDGSVTVRDDLDALLQVLAGVQDCL